MTREEAARRVAAECLWGDYALSADDIVRRLDRGEAGFDRFICSKVIENASHPSRLLDALFDRPHLRELLENMSRSNPRVDRRIRVARANLFGQYDLVPELSWDRDG